MERILASFITFRMNSLNKDKSLSYLNSQKNLDNVNFIETNQWK